MKKRYQKAALLLVIPLSFNLMISLFLFLSGKTFQFKGYMTGTITSAALSVIWLFQVKNRAASNVLNFMKMMLQGYAMKIIFLIALLVGGYMLFHFDRVYFVIAFFFGTFASIAVEVWYYISMSKRGVNKRP
jgi:hypothetical protein